RRGERLAGLRASGLTQTHSSTAPGGGSPCTPSSIRAPTPAASSCRIISYEYVLAGGSLSVIVATPSSPRWYSISMCDLLLPPPSIRWGRTGQRNRYHAVGGAPREPTRDRPGVPQMWGPLHGRRRDREPPLRALR